MNEFTDLLTVQVIIPTLLSIGTGLVGWLFGRRKLKADAAIMEARAREAEIGNLDRIAQMWQKTAEQFKNSYTELLEQNMVVQEQISALRKENKQLTDDVKKLNVMMEELRTENKSLILKINEHKKTIKKDEKA